MNANSIPQPSEMQPGEPTNDQRQFRMMWIDDTAEALRQAAENVEWVIREYRDLIDKLRECKERWDIPNYGPTIDTAIIAHIDKLEAENARLRRTASGRDAGEAME